MSAPVASALILPDDSSNTGDKLRTQTRVVGAKTVHERFLRPTLGVTHTGRYWFVSDTVHPTTAPNANASFVFQNPVASPIVVILRRIVFENLCAATSGTSAIATTFSFVKFTFTGVADDVVLPNLPWSTGAAASNASIRTTISGMTLGSTRPEITSILMPSIMSHAGLYYAAKDAYPFNPLAFNRGVDLEVAPGEGFLLWGTTPGSAIDYRYCVVQIVWDEIDPS